MGDTRYSVEEMAAGVMEHEPGMPMPVFDDRLRAERRARMPGRLASLLVVLAVSAALSAACTRTVETETVVYVPVAPPPARVVVRPSAPSVGHVWMPGRWTWVADRWVWVDGHYERPPSAGTRWVPGYWEKRPRGWLWIPGHWTRS